MNDAQKLTICVACRHHRQGAVSSGWRPEEYTWHQHKCGRNDKVNEFNYVVGSYKGERPYCKVVNTDGKCKDYVPIRGDCWWCGARIDRRGR